MVSENMVSEIQVTEANLHRRVLYAKRQEYTKRENTGARLRNANKTSEKSKSSSTPVFEVRKELEKKSKTARKIKLAGRRKHIYVTDVVSHNKYETEYVVIASLYDAMGRWGRVLANVDINATDSGVLKQVNFIVQYPAHGLHHKNSIIKHCKEVTSDATASASVGNSGVSASGDKKSRSGNGYFSKQEMQFLRSALSRSDFWKALRSTIASKKTGDFFIHTVNNPFGGDLENFKITDGRQQLIFDPPTLNQPTIGTNSNGKVNKGKGCVKGSLESDEGEFGGVFEEVEMREE